MPIVAVAVLLLNDHWGKPTWSNWWTGKISDAAGLAFFPLFLQALWETVQAALGRPWHARRRVLVFATIATVTVFTTLQLSEAAMDGYRYGVGALQWPLHAALAWARGLPTPPAIPVRAMADPTDIITVPAVLLSVAAGWHRSTSGGPQSRAATTPREVDDKEPDWTQAPPRP